MAITSGTVFEVRTAGSDTNGGGFNPAAAGTDYSQQDNARSGTGTNDSVTDAVGTSTTTVTSASSNFTSAIVGNIVYIQGKWYEVTVFTNSTTITVDRATGTFTGGTLNIGGALATMIPVFGTNVTYASSANITAWMKSGTYTLTSTWTMNNNAAGTPCFLTVGYNSSRGDSGTRPLITSATNSIDLITVSLGSSAVTFRNLSFSHTASTRAIGIVAHNSGAQLRVERCKFDGCSWGINGDNVGARSPWFTLAIVETEILNSTTGGVINYNNEMLIVDSWIHGNTGYGVAAKAGVSPVVVVRCIISGNTSYGLGQDGGSLKAVVLLNSVFYSNGGNGVTFTTANSAIVSLIARNCVFYGNTGYGLSADAAPLSYILDHCAYGANTTAALQNLTSGTGDVTLSANPFTNAGSGDFSLNSTAGGGAALKGVGYPGSFPGGLSTGGIDIGAIQTVVGAGASLVANPITGFIA